MKYSSNTGRLTMQKHHKHVFMYTAKQPNEKIMHWQNDTDWRYANDNYSLN